MPLLDSFKVDHTKMKAPAVRLAKTMTTKNSDIISVYDLRFCMPNKQQISEKAIHTLEHLFAGFIREHLNSDNVEIIDVSPMGCRTGFYMSLLGNPKEREVANAWEKSMQDVLKVDKESDIPELNIYQCGTYKMHSLKGAKEVAKEVLNSGVDIMENRDIQLSDDDLQKISFL